MKFILILPEICAKISWPFSNFTRKVAFGNVSEMVPSSFIGPCFAIRYETVKISGFPLTIAIVCSKCAEG